MGRVIDSRQGVFGLVALSYTERKTISLLFVSAQLIVCVKNSFLDLIAFSRNGVVQDQDHPFFSLDRLICRRRRKQTFFGRLHNTHLSGRHWPGSGPSTFTVIEILNSEEGSFR
jgi:hypothetical protein